MTRSIRTAFAIPLLSVSLLAGFLKPGRIRSDVNAPRFRPFTQLLSPNEMEKHALQRLTFGARPEDREHLRKIGLRRWLDLQLYPERIPENSQLEQALRPLETIRLSTQEAVLRYPARSAKDSKESPSPQLRAQLPAAAPAVRRNILFSMNPASVVADDLAESKLLRAVYSSRQFQEVLVDFWFNHFNVNLDKGADHYSVPSYERDVIRPHVFGSFQDLLLATAQSPAMLFYLDNWQSSGSDRGKNKRGLNENYGRELLELHTLGVDGGYSQQDVIAVARCFTGWTVAGPRKGGGFRYDDKMHDQGEKVVLGHVIPAGGGMKDGLEVIDLLAHNPATAHFISLQLARRFVADDPPPSLLNRMTQTFLSKNGDLRAVYSTMLHSPEFWSRGAYGQKLKTPFELVASALRTSGANISSAYAVCNELQRLGEPLFRKVEPNGYSNLNADWMNSGALIERLNFAVNLSLNRVPGIQVAATPDLAEAIGSPQFQRK